MKFLKDRPSANKKINGSYTHRTSDPTQPEYCRRFQLGWSIHEIGRSIRNGPISDLIYAIPWMRFL